MQILTSILDIKQKKPAFHDKCILDINIEWVKSVCTIRARCNSSRGWAGH